jgi:hypothetical protein
VCMRMWVCAARGCVLLHEWVSLCVPVCVWLCLCGGVAACVRASVWETLLFLHYFHMCFQNILNILNIVKTGLGVQWDMVPVETVQLVSFQMHTESRMGPRTHLYRSHLKLQIHILSKLPSGRDMLVFHSNLMKISQSGCTPWNMYN